MSAVPPQRMPVEVLEDALEMGRVGIWEWDLDTDEVRLSRVLCDILGLDARAHVDAQAVLGAIHPEDRPLVERVIEEAVAARGPYAVRHRILRPDGSVRWLRAKGHIASEGPRRILRGVALDVTAHEEVDRLRELSEFRARFLNVAAHELKTPLTPIRLQLQILSLKLEGTHAASRSIEIMRRAVDRLSQLVNDVLDAARVQATQLKVMTEPTDLGALVQEALAGYEQVAKEVGITLHKKLAKDVVVQGDPMRILQVANNLLSNAVKFTPAGGSIAVAVAKDGDRGVLTVRDSGAGLTPAQQAQLFQPFVQLHPQTQATARGTGLGLFIVKGIVEQHQGTVEVHSDGPGRGTSVEVRIPATLQPLPPRPAPAPPPPQMDALARRLRELV